MSGSGACGLERTPGIIARRIADETILVPTRRRAREMALFTLNEVASFVWDRLDPAQDVRSLALAVAGAFEVSAEQAGADVAGFLEALLASGCARIAPAPAGEGGAA